MHKIIVTTSWDDGAPEDIKILELLNKYNLRGTFYIPRNIHFEIEKRKFLQTVSNKEILEIAKTQEIGAHTMNHVYLNKLTNDEIVKEVRGSMEWLESLLKKEINMFAYPGGKFDDNIINIVKQCGFSGARTTEDFQIFIKNKFLMPGTNHVYPNVPRGKNWSWLFIVKNYFKHLIRNYKNLKKFNLSICALFFWKTMAKRLFNYVLKNGGVYHLWGHSWEIERYGMWDDFEEVLAYIANRNNVEYLTNSEIIKKDEDSFIER